MVTAVTDPLNHTTHYAYNPRQELISVTDPLGNQVQYGYNLHGGLFHQIVSF